MNSNYDQELKIAELAVQRAALLTQQVFKSKVKGEFSKSDKSPVTIADFGAQALIIKAIHQNFPNDAIVGEEDSHTLKHNHQIRAQVWESVVSTTLPDEAEESKLGKLQNEQEMLDMIDLGQDAGGPSGRKWALDPVDGTAGFLRGGQYAISLGLLVDGVVQVGVLGCPNLPRNRSAVSESNGSLSAEELERGIIISAIRGKGCSEFPLEPRGSLKRVQLPGKQLDNVAEAVLCEPFDSSHSSHDDQKAISKILGIHKQSVRMDSSAKYAAVARGMADIYLRLPTAKPYEERIWDHAAGYLIVGEVGGTVVDANGKDLDFSKGRTLKDNKGVVVCAKGLSSVLSSAVKEARQALL
jgi:3'(2'), 5'-bisphosphate nucleotidase